MFESYPDIIHPSDLAEMLRLGRTKIYQLLQNKVIPSRRIGGNYLIKKEDVIAFLCTTNN